MSAHLEVAAALVALLPLFAVAWRMAARQDREYSRRLRALAGEE